jgi:hypothetical protein
MRILLLALSLFPLTALAEDKRDDAAAEMAKADDLFFNQKDVPAAIAHYNAARLLAPDRPGPYLALGIAYAQLDDCKNATPMMQKYLQLKTSDPKPDAQRVLDACKARQACPPGQIKTADTAGHCCWPAQVWVPSENRCVGQPQCPTGFALGPHKQSCLTTGSCPPGKVVSQDPAQCCWPGQGYSHEKRSCVGVPACPANMVVNGENCMPAPTGRPSNLPRPRGMTPPPPAPLPQKLDANQLLEAMNTRVKPLVATCSQQYRARGQVRVTFTIAPDGTVSDARVLPPWTERPLGVCLSETLRSATFPQFSGPAQTVTFPFNLR